MANFLKRIQDCHIQDYDLTSRNTSRLSVLNSLGINPVIISTYLKIPMNSHLLRELALSSHFLRTETDRWHKPEPIPRDERLCKICNLGKVEDEFHFFV